MVKTFIRLVPFLLLFASTPLFAKQPIRSIEGIVAKVTDGDTINVVDPLGTKMRVRLYGIDAPETEKVNKKTRRISKSGQPYGNEASKALTGKVYRQSVRLDVIDADRYKRLVCLVWLGRRNINKEMVAEGWAWAYRDYLNTAYATEFIEVEERARGKRLGLWQQSNAEPPWEFRKSQRMR